MHVLVTGGAGFVGAHLCRALIELGHDVVCLDNFSTGLRENVEELIQGGRFTLLPMSVQNIQPIYVDRIYHLASPASPVFYSRFPLETIEANVEGTKAVLELAKRTGARMLYTSTSEIYGDPLEHPQAESYRGNVNPLGDRACYDESKRLGETLCKTYSNEVDVRIVRIFNTYGPRMRKDDGRVVSNFISQALQNRSITIYGSGEQTRSLQYVSDLIEGLLLTMELEENPGVLNLGRPQECTINELAKTIIAMTGSTSSIEYFPLPNDDPCRRLPDISKAKECLKWHPRITLEAGLENTIAHFRRMQLAKPKKEKRK